MPYNIGEKIKSRRKALNLTQAQIAGECITRNMLSLIENGNATPSLQTLEYLSERLEVPMAYFFSEDYDHEKTADEQTRLVIKKLYFEKSYELCVDTAIEHYTHIDDMPDELLLICAESAMLCGKSKTLKGAFESATYYLNMSRRFSSKCAYSTDWIDANVYLYESMIENSDCPIQSLDKEYYMKLRRCIGFEHYSYLYAIRLIDEKRGEDAAQFLKHNKVIETAHKEHINAKFMMLSENNELKFQALEFLCDMIKKAPSYPLDAITRYLILKDIEESARALDNYEMAYKYATMRLKIIADMRD